VTESNRKTKHGNNATAVDGADVVRGPVQVGHPKNLCSPRLSNVPPPINQRPNSHPSHLSRREADRPKRVAMRDKGIDAVIDEVLPRRKHPVTHHRRRNHRQVNPRMRLHAREASKTSRDERGSSMLRRLTARGRRVERAANCV
jgi:hypothetical protein